MPGDALAIDKPLQIRLSLESGLHLPDHKHLLALAPVVNGSVQFTSGRVSEPRLSSSPPFSSPGFPYPFPIGLPVLGPWHTEEEV